MGWRSSGACWSFLLELVELIGVQFVIGLLVLEHLVDDDEQRVGDGNQGLIDPPASRQPAKRRSPVGGVAPSMRPDHLAPHRFEPGIATPCLPAHTLAAALLV